METTKGKRDMAHCESCRLIRMVRNGMKYTIWDSSLGLKTTDRRAMRTLSTAEAVNHIRMNSPHRNCEFATVEEIVEVSEVKEIRREGQRILKAGANVRVQLKRQAGTKRSLGHVVACFDDGTVTIHVDDLGSRVTVPADEFVTARCGTTAVR